MASLNRSYILSRIMTQLAGEEKFVCLPSLALDIADLSAPDLSVYAAESVRPNFFEDHERVKDMPLVTIDIMDGAAAMGEMLEKAKCLLHEGVKACWILEPFSHSLLVLTNSGRSLYHEELVSSQGVEVDIALLYAGQLRALPGQVEADKGAGGHRLVEALRHASGANKIFLPSTGPEDWKRLLADPDQHWRRGRTTRAMAHSWEESNGLPAEVIEVFNKEPATRDAKPLFVVPEYLVPLPGGARPSQNDIWLLAETRSGLASITVDGKASESFGRTVGEWYAKRSEGKEVRLRFLCDQLGIAFPPPDGIKYSLLQRAVAAVIEARRFHAACAIMLVHSFSKEDAGLPHFNALLDLMKLKARPGELTSGKLPCGVHMFFGWVRGEQRFLEE